ncbi:hypothetical protein EST38_g3768 [Candolleomyces aberdarensis]|uniref:Protein kinase domain-containing protein n=1 Tax=Candolleomyces aberdarensis TaxID=2316362 RepID=A0A4Q2DTA7_9AGAR|nr:hypothetical protein EST38_g3768 [Candolleomyces aberdarensis]
MSKLPVNGTHPPLGTLIHDDTIQLVSVLGNGGYGVVFLGVDISSKRRRKYAVKCMSKAKGRRTAHVRELNFHLQVTGHPGVIECYGAVEDDNFTYFIMEYATSNDLFHQILHEYRYLAQDDTIKYVFLQLIEGVQHCHKMGVFHRDLKPENVMCFDDGHRVAITDFGLATSDSSSCEFRTGSVYHMSPECQAGHFREDAYSPVANDVWSLGIILVNMVTGRNPWKSATKEDPVYQNYLQAPLTFFSSVLPVSNPLNNLLVRVLNPEWKARMSLHDFKHAIQDISTFYSVNVHFEGNLASSFTHITLILMSLAAHTLDSGTVGRILHLNSILWLILILILIPTRHLLRLFHLIPRPSALGSCARSGKGSPCRDRRRRMLGWRTLLGPPIGITDAFLHLLLM